MGIDGALKGYFMICSVINPMQDTTKNVYTLFVTLERGGGDEAECLGLQTDLEVALQFGSAVCG